jgi:hypothetical protein
MEKIQIKRPFFKSLPFFISSCISGVVACESVQAHAHGLGGFGERPPYLRHA